MENFTKYTTIMEQNIEYKSVIIPLLPQNQYVKILDYGGGTGMLSKIIKISNPQAIVHLADTNPEMLGMAKYNHSADEYINPYLTPITEKYDVIILCSVLHEVEEKKRLIQKLYNNLYSFGQFIIRDGYAEDPVNNSITSYQLRHPEEAYRFYKACGNSIIGRLNLDFYKDVVMGSKNDLRAFLQTYTWGWDSMEREKHENQIWLSRSAALHLFEHKIDGFQYPLKKHYFPETLEYIPICQPNYFNHMNELIVMKDMWNTHAIVNITKINMGGGLYE